MFQRASNFSGILSDFLLKPIEILSLKNEDYVFYFGEKNTEILKNLGIKSNHIIEITNGIDHSLLSHSAVLHFNRIRRFVFVGRYERRKGI